MKCSRVQALLTAYLDNELTAREREMVQEHIAGCAFCQGESRSLASTRNQVGAFLKHRALAAAPLRNSWLRLSASLQENASASPSVRRPVRLFAAVRRLFPVKLSSGSPPRLRLIAFSLLAVVSLGILVFLMTRDVTDVSAQDVLIRAGVAESGLVPASGIQHFVVETYNNSQALTGGAGEHRVTESYWDLNHGKVRSITIDPSTGQVVDVWAYDGQDTYRVNHQGDSQAVESQNGQTIVYRISQDLPVTIALNGGPKGDLEQVFNDLKNSPNTRLVGKQTWSDGDGRQVYVLQMHGPVKGISSIPVQLQGTTSMYFDASTYQGLEGRQSVEIGGMEIVLGYKKILVEEVLPASTAVAWNLSDVRGIVLVDDPNNVHGLALPTTLSVPQLAARTSSAYLLRTVPDGYSLQLRGVPAKTPNNGPFQYQAFYTDRANDSFSIQSGPIPAKLLRFSTETYTTTAGLVLYLVQSHEHDPSGKLVTDAAVEAPGGVTFIITSSLPIDTVKAWAENLVLVK